MSFFGEFRTTYRTVLAIVDSYLESVERERTERVSMHDWDVPVDGADLLAAAEEQQEVWEPRTESRAVVYKLGKAERDRVWHHGQARMYCWLNGAWLWKRPDAVNWRWCSTWGMDIPSLDGVPFTPVTDDSSPASASAGAAGVGGEAVSDVPTPPASPHSNRWNAIGGGPW